MHSIRSSLAKRLLKLMFIVGIVVWGLSLVGTLVVEFKQDQHSLEQSIADIANSNAPGIAMAAWQLNSTQLNYQLQGMVDLDGVSATKFKGPHLAAIEIGVNAPQAWPFTYPISYQGASVGTLYLSPNQASLLDRSWHRLIRLASLDFLKAMIYAGTFFLIIRVFIAKRIESIDQKLLRFVNQLPRNYIINEPAKQLPPSSDEISRLENNAAHLIDTLAQTLKAQERIMNTDYLTGLISRNHWISKLEQQISKNPAQRFHVLIIDLDQFKPINDRYGHITGDKILTNVATRLQDISVRHYNIARMGGDEFAIMIVAPREEAFEFAQKIIAAIEATMTVDLIHHHISCSVGLACYPSDATTAAGLCAAADMAMYRAKRDNERKVLGYVAQFGNDLERALKIKSELANALETETLSIKFQPIVCLRTNEVLKHEVLARWKHPVLGQIQPEEFVPIAEQYGMIASLGSLVLHQTTRAFDYLRMTTGQSKKFTINKSILEFKADQSDTQELIQLLSTKERRGFFSIELTESAFLSANPYATQAIHQMAAAGIELIIDDFGTGYSNLGYLLDLPITWIKIDRSFIEDVAFKDQRVLVAIVNMTKKLGIKTVVEGVATSEQLKLAKASKADAYQGFYYSHPVDLLTLIEKKHISNGC